MNRVMKEEAGRVKFPETGNRWWNIRAASDRYVVLTQQALFRPKGEMYYTVVDLDVGVRGPCNLIGQGWGDGRYDDAECAAMLAEFDSGEIEVSHRNRVTTRVVDARGREGAALAAAVTQRQVRAEDGQGSPA